MGKKKQRKQKITVYGIVEGEREQLFLNHLVEVYRPRENGINPEFKYKEKKKKLGGDPSDFLNRAFRECFNRQRCFAWFDEDKPLHDESKKKLAEYWCITDKKELIEFLQCPLRDLQRNHNTARRRNPILIISQPVCVESLILRALGKKLPYELFDSKKRDVQIKGLKDTLENNVLRDVDEREFYLAHLSREVLESNRSECAELDLLISMITV